MREGVELVREIVEALNRGDLDAMLARMDPEFEWTPLENSPVGRAARGHEEVRAYVEDWFGAFESMGLELEELTEAGEHVVAVVLGHGRGRASELALESRFCQLWTVREGRALRMEEHATREAALAATEKRS
jgi:ketosteroid isomerase-like protein